MFPNAYSQRICDFSGCGRFTHICNGVVNVVGQHDTAITYYCEAVDIVEAAVKADEHASEGRPTNSSGVGMVQSGTDADLLAAAEVYNGLATAHRYIDHTIELRRLGR